MDLGSSFPRPLILRNAFVIASPLLVLVLGGVAARVSILLFAQWAWAGAAVVYWGSLVLILAAFTGRAGVARWFDRPRGSRLWPVVAVLVGLAAIPMLLLPNLRLLGSPLMLPLWLLYGLINGTLEEAYWRGFLFNEIRGWPQSLKVAYSSTIFVSIHFVMLGAFAKSLFNIPFLVILIALTLIYAAMYLNTRSLRWPVLSHILSDLGNMNIFVFMNLIHLP